jgi:DNA-binding NtrC family response regulator
VLVVEDTWSVAKAMKAVFEELGMHVVGPTASVAEASRLLAAHSPKLAVVDVNLKHETACNLIDELYEQGVPVVVVSGYAVPPIAKEKVAAFLPKPFNGTELITTIRGIVERFS